MTAQAPLGPDQGAHSPTTAVLRRWGSLARLNGAEVALLAELCLHEALTLPGREFAEHTPFNRAMLILEGCACHLRLLTDGRRQIIRFILPGDGVALGPGPDFLSRPVALTRIRWVDATALRDVASEPTRWPGLAAAMQRSQFVEDTQFLDQLVRLGRQSGYERVAHLLLELHDRASAAGLAVGPAFLLPVTQEMMADALGLSTVHVNRILQQMRTEKLLSLVGGRAILLKPKRLARIAEFTPRAVPSPEDNQERD